MGKLSEFLNVFGLPIIVGSYMSCGAFAIVLLLGASIPTALTVAILAFGAGAAIGLAALFGKRQ